MSKWKWRQSQLTCFASKMLPGVALGTIRAALVARESTQGMLEESVSTSMRTFLLKSIIGSLVAIASIAGGVYVGNSLSDSSPKESIASVDGQALSGGPPQLSLRPGDLFPAEPAYIDKRPTDFSSILKDREAIVLFVSLDCGPCLELMQFWKNVSTRNVRPEVQQVIVLSDTASIPAEYAGLFEGLTTVRYRQSDWKLRYNQDFWPTIVGVDDSGFITHIQYGFENAIDHQLVSRFYLPNKH